MRSTETAPAGVFVKRVTFFVYPGRPKRASNPFIPDPNTTGRGRVEPSHSDGVYVRARTPGIVLFRTQKKNREVSRPSRSDIASNRIVLRMQSTEEPNQQ